MLTDKEAYGLAFTGRLGRRIYKINSLLHEKKNTPALGPFKAADRFGSGLRQKTPYFGEIGLYFPWPLEAIHAAAKLKLRAIWPT